MLTMIGKRLLFAIPSLIGVVIVTFLLTRALPGDPARLQAGPEATPADIEAIRKDMGLDGPIWSQYLRWAGNTVEFKLGRSSKTRLPVADEIGSRFFPTLWLTIVSSPDATALNVPYFFCADAVVKYLPNSALPTERLLMFP